MNLLIEKELKREYIYKGKILTLRVDTVELENGRVSTREIVEHNGAVAILPVNDRGEVFLVRQFRKPLGMPLLEVPAGKLEKNENPRECAIRELKEETGLIANKIEELGFIYTTPGFSDEKIHLYFAGNLHQDEVKPDEDEFINVEKMKYDDFIYKCMNGEISDSKTLAIAFRSSSKVKAFTDDK